MEVESINWRMVPSKSALIAAPDKFWFVKWGNLMKWRCGLRGGPMEKRDWHGGEGTGRKWNGVWKGYVTFPFSRERWVQCILCLPLPSTTTTLTLPTPSRVTTVKRCWRARLTRTVRDCHAVATTATAWRRLGEEWCGMWREGESGRKWESAERQTEWLSGQKWESGRNEEKLVWNRLASDVKRDAIRSGSWVGRRRVPSRLRSDYGSDRSIGAIGVMVDR